MPQRASSSASPPPPHFLDALHNESVAKFGHGVNVMRLPRLDLRVRQRVSHRSCQRQDPNFKQETRFLSLYVERFYWRMQPFSLSLSLCRRRRPGGSGMLGRPSLAAAAFKKKRSPPPPRREQEEGGLPAKTLSFV